MKIRVATHFAALAALTALLLVAAACSSSGGGSDRSAARNHFLNGGFENGKDPWFALKPPEFQLSQDVVHSGENSVLLEMRDGPEESGNQIYYLVQEFTADALPETLSGYYRVENWNKGTRKQYLQFVVIVFDPANMTGSPNFQIRYLVAGIDSPPFPIGNAKFIFLSREDPVTDEWVYFERNVREDFQEVWGTVPEGFDNVRVLFEVRWDDKVSGDGAPQGDIYYDDLYWGPPDGAG